jgi:hypothetical protein
MNKATVALEDAFGNQTAFREGGEGAVAILWAVMAGLLPLFFGGVTGAAQLWRETLSCACILLWSITLFRQRRLPRCPSGLVIPCALIVLTGWVGALNPSFQFQGYRSGFVSLSDSPVWLPSAVDSASAVKAMQHWTLVLAVLLMLTDLCSERQVRSNIRTGILLGGLAVLFIGLAQKLADARTVLGSGKGANQPFFGTFIYPGAAGAYFNLLFPGFCLAAAKPGWSRAVGTAGIAGVFVSWLWNTSRISTFIGVLTACSVLCLLFLKLRAGGSSWMCRERAQLFRRHRTGIAASCLLLLLTAYVFPVPPQFSKWIAYSGQVFGPNPRFEAMKVCVQIAGDSGVWGMGPGAFPLVFPYYAAQSESLETLRGFWRHAHCDYLEFLIEWGWLGSLPWMWLGGCIALKSVKQFRSRPVLSSWETLCTAAALGLVCLHAVLDSPLQNPSVLMVALFWAASAVSKPDGPDGPEAARAPDLSPREFEARTQGRPSRRLQEGTGARRRPAPSQDQKRSAPRASTNRR